MASLINISGKRSIQFKLDGKRRTIYLGKLDQRSCRAVQMHVERLVMARTSGQPVTDDTAAWVKALPMELYSKLANVGLVQKRPELEAMKLASAVKAYIAKRHDLRPRSKTNIEQAGNQLVTFFGAARDVRTITEADAKSWHRSMKLAEATVTTHVKKARQIFQDLIDQRILTANPFRAVKAGSMTNDERFFYVSVPVIEKVISACPDREWRLVFALARYAGLRVPSETKALRLDDIQWDERKLLVRASKTDSIRFMPILPELMPYLREVFDHAGEGQVYAIEQHRGENLRTMADKIVRRAGLEVWPKLFQNMRSSCETDLADIHPIHIVCKWIGNTEAVARRHYLQLVDRHFDQASGLSAKSAASYDDQRATRGEGKSKNRVFDAVDATPVPPRGCETPGTLLGKLTKTEKALQKALHRASRKADRADRRGLARLARRVRRARGNK